MISSPGIMEAPSLGNEKGVVKCGLLRRPRRVSRMLRVTVGVTEIEVPKINRQRHRGAQHAHGIALVDRKIAQHEEASDRAAFPKAERNHALASAFRGDPLNNEPETKNERAG